MGTLELLLIGIGLSMDAFAVSITNGMCKKNIGIKWALGIGLTFGLFQGAMPVIGYALGSNFTEHIEKCDHIIALVLLGFIGGKMIIDSLKKDNGDNSFSDINFSTVMVQGLATSIDALAVGVSFAAMNVNIVRASAAICLITIGFSTFGVIIGKKFGGLLSNKAQIFGGIILVGIGVKIFLQHIFF